MTDRTSFYTVPGGIKLFFKKSGESGFRDLGNIISPQLEQQLETIEHFCSRSGTRTKDKEAIIQKAMSLGFTFDEPNAKNLQLAFLGGAITDTTAASTEISNEGITLFGTATTGLGFQMHETHGVVVKNWAGTVTYDLNAVYEITGVTTGTKTFTVAGDHEDQFAADRTFTVTGSTGNDGTYTVDSATFDTDHTDIVVDEVISSATVDGDINAGDYVVSVSGNTVARTAYSTITDGADVLVTYNWNAPAFQSFPVFDGGIIEGEARFLISPTSGAQIFWDIPKIEIRPSGAIGIDDQNWMGMPMTLNILDNSSSTPNAAFGTFRFWLA